MKSSKTANVTPQSTPPSSVVSRGGADSGAGDEHFIWTALVPRLVHPTKLAIVKVLIGADQPMSVDDLTPLLPATEVANPDSVIYHARTMAEAGVLEVTSMEPSPDGEAPSYRLSEA